MSSPVMTASKSLLSKINRSWTSSPEFIGLREL
jgi:hypothetical protein